MKISSSQPLVIVDVETTGMSPEWSRITEIACIRLEDGKETDRFVSLIDPEERVPESIQKLTGIMPHMLSGAPTFYQVADRIEQIFDGALLCAHNARFDYGFLRAEMGRLDRDFTKKILCTARLSRKLFPRFRRHDLSSLIERHGLSCSERHRAEGDAEALRQFIALIESDLPEKKVSEAVHTVSRHTSFPEQIPQDVLLALPEAPGVYSFYGKSGELLYIGKSKNIRSRVFGHFSGTHASGKEMRLWQETHDITYERTASDLGASLLELYKIKAEQPLYNRLSRRVRGLWTLEGKLGKGDYLTLGLRKRAELVPEEALGIYAVFRTKDQAKRGLESLALEHGLCKKLLGLEKGPGPCFGSQLEQCRGACTGKVPSEQYNAQIEQLFAARRVREWPHPGAVALVFSRPEEERGEAFVIENWILKQAAALSGDTVRPLFPIGEFVFDYDIYRLLLGALTLSENRERITSDLSFLRNEPGA